MNPERVNGTWSLELDSVRAGDFLHLCTEPDGRLRLASNLNYSEAREILRRGIVDLEVGTGLAS